MEEGLGSLRAVHYYQLSDLESQLRGLRVFNSLYDSSPDYLTLTGIPEPSLRLPNYPTFSVTSNQQTRSLLCKLPLKYL